MYSIPEGEHHPNWKIAREQTELRALIDIRNNKENLNTGLCEK